MNWSELILCVFYNSVLLYFLGSSIYISSVWSHTPLGGLYANIYILRMMMMMMMLDSQHYQVIYLDVEYL